MNMLRTPVWSSLIISLLLVGASTGQAPHGIEPRLPRSAPEAQGISSQAILEFVDAADKMDAIHSFMLLRHGHVVAEGWWTPYAPEDTHQLYSLSKSFTSTAVGIAMAEGRLSLDDTVASFFPDELPDKPSSNLRAMRIRDLLSMSTGHVNADLGGFLFGSDEVLTREFLALPVEHKPGTHFLYNTPATYMCSAIVQKVTGEKLVDYLQTRLFDPLGIPKPHWTESKQGISHGGFGLNLRTEDIACFGQLYLQRGEWGGKQINPEKWVTLATSRQTSNGSNPNSDWEQGYGYQFWRCRHGMYRGDGAFGQFCIVMPDHDAVLAITSGTSDMGAVMQLAWDYLLPAMTSAPLNRDRAAHQKLRTRLRTLRLPPVEGEAFSLTSNELSGAMFTFADNPSQIQALTVDFDDHRAVVTLQDPKGKHEFECTYGKWAKRRMPSMGALATRLPRPELVGVAGSGAWRGDDSYAARLWLFETPYRLDIRLKFEGDTVTLDGEYNVAFGPKTLPSLSGTRVAQSESQSN